MAKGFNLTAELNLRGPGNLKQIASAIRREIGTIDATVKVKLDKSAERSILNTSNALARLNKELQTTAQASALTTSNITGLVGAINSLGGALNGSNSSMSQIVSSAQATTQQMAKLKKGTVEARSEMEEFGRQSALAVRRFAAFNLATGVIFGLIGAVSKATMEFIEFDKQIVRLTQITGESYEQLSRITNTITGLSTGLGVASSDLIKISDTLAQAGFSARETDQALRALALTALAPSFENLNETVEGSIALMRQFKISTEDLDKALGSINAVAAGFAVEASDIITAIQRTGGVFASASKGVSQGTDALNEFIAVFTSVRATTRESAETIATGLRTIFTRIQREDTIDALQEYGVNLLDVEGKFVGAYKAVKLLSEGLGKLDPRDTSFSRIVEELGGFRQIGKVLPLIQEFATAQQALGVAQRGQSSLAQDAIKAQSSLAVQFSKTRESFVALIRDIGNSDSFKTLVSLGLTLANTFIKVADVAKPLLPIITAIGAIKGAKALTSYVGGFVGGLRKNKPSSGGPGSPTAGGEDQAAAARSQQIADSYANNSTALNNTTSALNNLTTAISPLTASIDNLGNGVMTQLLNEITSLNNNLSSLPPGGGTTLNRGGIVRKFAKGGSVPGSGNTDSVPALLTPGEFVVNKKSARAVGSKNLHRINGYAKGGPIAANITDTTTSDGDTLNVNFTPEQKPFNTLSRLENWDAFETDDVPGFKIPEWQRKLGRAAAKVTSEEYNKQDNKALKAFKASNGAMDNYGRPMFKDDNLGSKLKNLGLAMPYKGKGKAPTKQLSTWGDYRNIFGYAPSQAPGLQGDNISEDDVVKKALGGMVQRFADGGWVKRMQQQSPEKLDGELGLLNSTLDLFGFQRKVPVSTFSKSSPFMEDAGIKEVRERISAIKEFLASKEPQKKKKAEKEITLPKAPSNISDHLKSLIEGNKKYEITKGVYGGVVRDALNRAYKGDVGPGSKQQDMDKVGPKSIVRYNPDREYVDVPLGVLENDLKYIDKVTKLEGRDVENLTANKGYSVSDMLDTIRAYQAIGLDGVINPALGRKEDLNQSLGDFSDLNKTERKKLGPGVEKPLSYYAESLDAAMQFSLPEKLYSGIGASKQKLFVESAGVKINKLEDTKKLVGKTVSIPSFLSTSEVPATAESFARTGMMTIETNKKSKGLSPERAKTDTINRDKSKTRKIDQRLISDSFGKGKADESFADDYDIESEYILPRNSKFKVKNIEANDNSEEGGNILESLNMDWAVKMLNAGGKVQKFAEGGVAQRKVGYIDYDVIANEANKDIVEKGMKETGSDGPRIYSDYLTKLAVNARKSANIQKLRAIYGVAGSGKTTLARGQGTDNARLRQTERFPILSPEDIDRATEILILTSSVSKTKMDDFFGDVDRAYTLSSTTSTERSRVKDQRGSRDVTGVGLEGRQPGTTMGVSTDTAVGEALLSDKLGDRSTVLGRSGSGRLRRKSGNELVDIIKKRIGFTWGGFAPTTAGHESIMDAAAAMGIPPEDFIALVGANEAVDPSSYRTAIFDQDARVLLAKAGFGAQGATVLPKPRDFEVPQGFDITQQGSDRRQVLIPGKGSTAFVADKTEDQTAKYKQAGYDVKSIERTGGISGTMVRDLIIAGDMAKLQSVLSPGVYDLVSNNIGRIQNRASVLPSLIAQAQKEAQAEMSQVDQQIEALGIKRIDSKKLESDPEYAAKVEVLKELRSKKQKMKSAVGFTPYKLLDALAQKDPQNYALDFSAPAIMGNVPGMRVMGQNSQAPEAPMPVGRVAQLAQEKNKSIQEVILEQLGALGGPAGIKRILGIGSGDRTLSSLLQAGNIKGGKGLDEAADYVNKALSAKGIRDAAEAKRLEEYQASAMHFGIAGLLPMDYSKEFEWDIGGTNVYATARGFGSTYLEEARQMQKESSALAQRFAENVQNKNIFGGGEKLAFDFDKTLVEDADILDAKGKPDIAKYSNRDAVAAALKNARPTRLAAKLKSLIEQDPPFIKKTRILTARPQSTADLLAQSLQSFGLPYAATDVTGVSGGPSSNIAALKAANLQQEEKLIDDSLDNIMAVRKAGKKGFQYTEPKSTTSELDEKMGQGNIEGAIIEKALAVLGAPIRPDAKQNRAIDYPDGLGSAAQFFPGIDPGIPTEVKRTIDGTSLEKVREEIGRHITGDAEVAKLASGGRVQRFEVGGEVAYKDLKFNNSASTSNQSSNKDDLLFRKDTIKSENIQNLSSNNTEKRTYLGGGKYLTEDQSRSLNILEKNKEKNIEERNKLTDKLNDRLGKISERRLQKRYKQQRQKKSKDITDNMSDSFSTEDMEEGLSINEWYTGISKIGARNLNRVLEQEGYDFKKRGIELDAKTDPIAKQKEINELKRLKLETETIEAEMSKIRRQSYIQTQSDSTKQFKGPSLYDNIKLNDKKAQKFMAGGVAEPEQKKEKEYGKISITEDGGMISVGYLKSQKENSRQGHATASKLRDNLYYVGLSSATKGYGPRLYDVLMEAVTEKGAMLTSDRSSVSGDARKVWEYYFKNRGDVKKTPLEPKDWTQNEALLDPKLYGRKETWPPADDPAWVLQSGYTKSPNLIKGPDVVRPNAKPDSRAMALSYFSSHAPKFANGGIVPGSGNRDTVPASLTAGDFVIRKSSVAKLGLGGSQGFASGGEVPALLTPGELVVPQAQAKKIGYGKLNTMNKYGRYNKGGAVGIQRFEMGGEVLTPAEMSTFRSSMAAVMATFSDEVSSAVDKIDLPTINTSSWDTMRKSLDEINKVMRNSFATVSDDVINKMRKMTSAGRQALEDIDLERVKARQNEIASSRGYSSADRDKMKSDVADASDARGSVRDRKIKNSEREAEGKAPFPVLDLMEMMRSAVGRKPDPINVKPPVSSDDGGRGTKSAEDYRSELNYSDVQTPGPIGPRGELYAQALSKEDPTDINTVVKELRTSFEAAMASIGKQPSKIGKSQSWATWDIGKQLHMRENPQESSDKYKLGNPLDDGKLRLQMVQRQVGYEVSGGRDSKGKNIPSFELVEIGAKAMAESLGKNEAALDAFINTLNSLNRSLYTKEDILGSSTSGSTTVPPIPSPSGVPTAPPVPVPPVVPPITPPTVPPKPPVPPTAPPAPPSPSSGGPNPGNAEAAVERYMAAMEAAAKAVKMQTYQAERLAGATASEAKARADAAGQAAAQALAQQRLVGATTEETIAIADAITRTSKVKGGGTLSRDDMKLPAQALARGGAPAPDSTNYAAATKANIDSINSMTDNFMKFSVALAASEGVSEFVGLIGRDSALGQAVNNLVSSFTSTSALFIAADGAISAFTNVLSSEKTADYLNNFSDYLTSASRGVENFSAGFSGSAAKGVLDRIASGLGSGSGMIGKIAGNLPQIASGVSGALSSLAGPVGAVVTAFNVASSLFIGITDSLRQSKLDASIKSFDDNLKYAEQALNTYSRNTTENAGQLQLANAAIMTAAKEARTQSDITKTNPQWSMTNIIGEGLSLGAGGQESVSQRAEILDKKGMMAYIGSLTDVTGRTQEQYTRELIPQKAAETAEKFKKPAELQQRVFEERFKKGESSSDIMSSPDWKQQAEVLARSNAGTEQQLRSIDADLSLSQQARDVKKQELMAIVAANGVRDQEVKYIRNKNSEDANDASSKMLYGLERMLGNMEQSINVVTYSMNKLADQTDLLKASMTGDAKIGATRIDASNVLQNPNMYSADERSKAADVGSQFFGPQAQDMKGLLQFGPDLENTILSTINRTIQEDPGASSGKIEARISQNIERDLGNLNIDEGLKKTLSKDISSSLSESQKSGDDKINYQQVFGEASAFSKTVQSTKKAQEAALKALEFYQQSVNNYAQSMNEAVALQMSSNEKMRRADDIRVRGEMTLAKTLGKSISLESSKSAANAGVMSQAGTADPRQIMNNIGRLEMTRQNQQASVDASAQRGPKGSKDLMAFTSQLSGTTMQLRDNYAALKSLADSTEVADAALSKMSEIKAKNEAGLGILERFISSTPKEQAKLNQSFERLDRNMNGQANNMWDSMRVQEAYNDALKNGGSMQDAQEAADQAAAQDRGDTMEAFKMLAPYLGDNQNDLKANMLESMMTESGVEMSPMFNQVLEGLRSPESDPEMAAALNEYKTANALQVQANQYLAALDGTLAQQIGTQAQAAFSNSLAGVNQLNANANANDIKEGINKLNNHLQTGVTKVSTVSSGTTKEPPIPGMAKGGVVEYMAVGGSIFKPKGSDTVPAMLTPGEFVVNKSAASANGPLLHAMNNGYSKGGSVKYYSEGGWVSDMLKPPDAGRFKDADPKKKQIYTKYNDYATFGGGDDIKKNLDTLKSEEGFIQFIKPYSVPTFNGTSEKLYSSMGNPLLDQINSKVNESIFGVLPDFTLSRNVLSSAAAGGLKGAAVGTAIRAGAGSSFGATAGAAASNATGTVDGAPLGIGGSLGGYVWEAMKFVPGLGAAISGIDAVRELLKGNLGAAAIEGLGAVLNLIPIPGASFIGKPLTGALKFLLKKMPFLSTFGAKIGSYVPTIFKTIAPGLYDSVGKFFSKNTQDLVMDLIPSSWKKKLGTMAWKMTGSATTGTAIADAAASVAPTLVKNAIPGMAGIGAASGAVSAISGGAVPNIQTSVADKLKSSMVMSNFKYPSSLNSQDILENKINTGADALSLDEAKEQFQTITPWMIALDRAAKWEKVKTPPKAKVSVGGTAYSQYGFGPESPEGGDKFMFASSVKSAGDFNIDQLPRFTAQADKMLQFTPGGYPTLGSDEASPAATSFYGQQGIDFSDTTALNKVGNIEDFSILEQTFRDYYNDLLEANPLGTTADSYDNKFWTPAAPAEQKQSKTNLILSALAEGTKFKYSFNKDELSPAATSLFKWRKESTTDKPADGSKPKEPSSDMLTVYSKAIRSRWESIISSETNKQAATDGRIWDGDNNTGFNVYKGTDKSKFEPLPWTTDTGLIGAVAEAELQKVQDQVIQDKIGLNISPPTSYNKMVDLPSSKRKLPVYFDYQPFQSIPLLNPEDTEYTENTPKSFMIDGANVASKGLFIKNRTTDYGKAVSPFQTLNQSANTELPYFSNEESLDAEVQKWAISNFDLPDFSLAGVKLATMYNPIVAEKAFKASSSIRSARTSRKEGAKVDSQEASGAAALLQKMQAPLFYNDDYQLGDNIPYGDAKDIIIGKLPGISEAMQLAAIQDTSMSKDEKRKKMQQEAAKILIKPEHIPSLGETVWQNVKRVDIPMIDGLKTSSDWIKAASEDGMSPPEEIKTQTDLLDAIDYISWVKSKVLSVTQKAQGQSKEKLAEVQNMTSEAAFGKYVSAGRFMSQISAGEEGAAAISSKASERLYSKYGSEIDKWTTTENAALATVKKKDGTARGGKESTSKRKFWKIPEIIKDKSFADFILGFAAQQRGAQRFNQLITGNGDAKLNQDQTTAIGAVYENFAAGEKAITTDKDGKSSVMKGVGGPSGNQAVDIALPTDINGVRDQFMNLETVYEPEYREVLGGTLLQLGERYATKWAKSGDPGTEEWSSIWTDYSDKLTSLKAFLTARDELLMRPVGLEGEALYPPAVLPALTGGVVNTLKQAGAEVPDDITARLEAAVSSPGEFMGIVQTLLAEASARIPGADSEDYKKRDEAEGIGAQIKKFYNENFASGALPRVFTEEGQEYWKEMKELYPKAKEGWEMFSGGVSGEAASDTTVPFDALDRIYNENQMPSAQGTKYGFYYMKNKKHGTNNTVEAMQREAEAANPKPETKAATATSGSVVDQAVANAATQEVGTPSPPSEEEVKNIVGPGEKPQEPVAKAKGGLIYRAAGGKAPVNWTPRGTDSVPAMLTPGEYVINRSSTQKYLPILEAINNGNSSQGAIAAAVQAGGVPATSYASRGGVISPRYFSRGAEVGAASGVSNSYSMGFDSATLAAIKQFDTSVQAFGEALSQLSIGNIKLDEAALSALGDFATKFDQFTQSLLKLNVPPVISITGQHEVNVNLNGASIFSTMEESVQNMIVNEINKAFGQLSKDNEGGIAMNYRPGPPTA